MVWNECRDRFFSSPFCMCEGMCAKLGYTYMRKSSSSASLIKFYSSPYAWSSMPLKDTINRRHCQIKCALRLGWWGLLVRLLWQWRRCEIDRALHHQYFCCSVLRCTEMGIKSSRQVEVTNTFNLILLVLLNQAITNFI